MHRLLTKTRLAGGSRTLCCPIKGPQWMRDGDDDDGALERLMLLSSQRGREGEGKRGKRGSRQVTASCFALV
jgi:hypothetical protein